MYVCVCVCTYSQWISPHSQTTQTVKKRDYIQEEEEDSVTKNIIRDFKFPQRCI